MKHLIIIDESNFDFFNTTVLIRLLIYNNEQFKSTTNYGIDIVFIDDLSFMKLENSKRLNITNMNMILNTYLSFLRQQCKNFLNTGSSIIVIVSIRGTDYGLYKAECNGEYFSLDCAYNEVQSLCDNIISVCKEKRSLLLKIQLVKSIGYTINMPVSVLCDTNYCAIGNNIEVLQIEDEKKNGLLKALNLDSIESNTLTNDEENDWNNLPEIILDTPSSSNNLQISLNGELIHSLDNIKNGIDTNDLDKLKKNI